MDKYVFFIWTVKTGKNYFCIIFANDKYHVYLHTCIIINYISLLAFVSFFGRESTLKIIVEYDRISGLIHT